MRRGPMGGGKSTYYDHQFGHCVERYPAQFVEQKAQPDPNRRTKRGIQPSRWVLKPNETQLTHKNL